MASHDFLEDPVLPEVECPEPAEGQYWTYILQSANGLFYAGQSANLPERMRKHRYGLGAKHTREHGCHRLVYCEAHPTREAAVNRELQLKGWSKAKKQALVLGDITGLKALSRRRK